MIHIAAFSSVSRPEWNTSFEEQEPPSHLDVFTSKSQVGHRPLFSGPSNAMTVQGFLRQSQAWHELSNPRPSRGAHVILVASVCRSYQERFYNFMGH